MDWLNYHHLLYFYVVAREGGVGAAAASLNLSGATISSQVKKLERTLGEKLFERSGRGLVLTDRGKLVQSYAESIFALGREMQSVLRSEQGERGLRLVVGITDVVPKLVAFRLLQPVQDLAQEVVLVCKEGKAESLLPLLSTHELDILITDAPAPPQVRVRAYNHRLGRCGISFFAAPSLARGLEADFPACLNEVPLLLPTVNTTLRRSLDHWLAEHGLHPRVAGEFEDSALLKVFGQSGAGVFTGPRVIESDIIDQYGAEVIGRTEAVQESFYAVALERRLRHPAVRAVSRAAREELFS